MHARTKKYQPNKLQKAYWGFRNWFRDSIFEPIWYRYFGHKFHIIKTGLKPSPWYDSDSRILFGVMSVVEWFVENDMRTPTKEQYEEELERINREETDEYKKSYAECWKQQYEENSQIMAIYLWWKAYPKRNEEIAKALHEWADYENKFREDPSDWFSKKLPKTDEEEKEERRLLDRHWEMEKQLNKEEQEYLKLAIDLRGRMWS